MAEPGAEAPPAGAVADAPSLRRRMACFVYEAMLLFGVALIPAAIGTIFLAQTGQRHPLQSETAIRVYALVLYAIYFVGCWSVRGQTLAMQTWRIRVIAAAGGRLSQPRALARFAACCLVWFGPGMLVAGLDRLGPWPTLGVVVLGMACYALSTLAAPGRQFWHDLACGTRLVDAAAGAESPRVRPRPR